MLDLEISAIEAAAIRRIRPGDIVFLDVREPWEYSTARIEGSKHMPMGDIPSRIFQELDPGAHVITVCHSGIRSLKVAVWMREQGFEVVQSMRGGIDAWSCEVDVNVPKY